MAQKKSPEITTIRSLRPDYVTPVTTPVRSWDDQTKKPQGVEPHSPTPTRPMPMPGRPQGQEES
jgi:hypothetical protein